MRFFAGGLNHAKTVDVHQMKARTTGECAACMDYLAKKRLGMPVDLLPESRPGWTK